jgi:hypothetical protein
MFHLHAAASLPTRFRFPHTLRWYSNSTASRSHTRRHTISIIWHSAHEGYPSDNCSLQTFRTYAYDSYAKTPKKTRHCPRPDVWWDV